MQKDAKNRVLVVDDEPDLREIIAFDFEAAGYTVDCAEDGITAWKALSQFKYDAIVSDIRMPNSDGVSLLKKVKAVGVGEEPIMVFITGYSDLTLEDAYHLGIDGFFAKPFDRRELVRAIERLLTPPSERWSKALKNEGTYDIQNTYKNIEEAMRDHDFILGRGGMFLASTKFSSSVGSRISFDLNFGTVKIVGTGLVRWIRTKVLENLKPGFGIEFESLSKDSLKVVKDLLKELYSQKKSQAFIPRG